MLANDPGQDGTGARAAFAPDVFGTTLDYYEGDYTRNGTNIALRNGNYGTSKWTGLIASERWATSNAPGFAPVAMQMKAYTYDRDGQLTQSLFGAFAQTGIPANPWDFTANGNFDYKETFSYDRNGNLKELTRNATATTVGTTPISNATDALVYHYDATPGKRNRLQKITDNTPAANDGKRGDIRNQTSSTNYFYQSDGKVYADLSEDAWYVYNGFGELEAVYNVVLVGTTPTKGTRLRERYYYDDGGMRLMRETWTWHLGDEPSHIKVTTATRTWYIRDAGGAVLDVYEQNWVCSTSCMAPVFSQSPVIKETYLYAQTRLGVFRRTGLTDGTETSYELTDHLGNVRSVIQRRRNGTAVVVEQRTDYYAHGWAMPGRDVHLTSNGYRFAYQGIELDPATGNHFFELRTFDARTARWTNPDPMMQFYSPYLAMGNNPVSVIDPNGGSGFSFDLGTAIGAVTFLANISYSKGNGAGDPLNSHSDWMDAPDRAGGWSIDWKAAWTHSAAASMAGAGMGGPPPGNPGGLEMWIEDKQAWYWSGDNQWRPFSSQYTSAVYSWKDIPVQEVNVAAIPAAAIDAALTLWIGHEYFSRPIDTPIPIDAPIALQGNFDPHIVYEISAVRRSTGMRETLKFGIGNASTNLYKRPDEITDDGTPWHMNNHRPAVQVSRLKRKPHEYYRANKLYDLSTAEWRTLMGTLTKEQALVLEQGM